MKQMFEEGLQLGKVVKNLLVEIFWMSNKTIRFSFHMIGRIIVLIS